MRHRTDTNAVYDVVVRCAAIQAAVVPALLAVTKEQMQEKNPGTSLNASYKRIYIHSLFFVYSGACVYSIRHKLCIPHSTATTIQCLQPKRGFYCLAYELLHPLYTTDTDSSCCSCYRTTLPVTALLLLLDAAAAAAAPEFSSKYSSALQAGQ
jgi:hypothetical protein